MKVVLLAASLALLSSSTALPGARSESSEEAQRRLAEKVQAHYDRVYDFEAQFVQRYQRRLIRKQMEESGRVAFKKPGRMRWEYLKPEEKLFVSDGASSYFYLPMENQVMVSHEQSGPMAISENSPFGLLTGKSRLSDSFEFFPAVSEPLLGGAMLTLVPLRAQEDFEKIELEVRSATGQVLRVILHDVHGNRTEFLFTEIRENVNLPESQFRFTVPPGVDIVLSSGTDEIR